MFYVSELYYEAPKEFKTLLQQKVYETLDKLDIKYKRVDNQEAYTMEDCVEISKRLGTDIIKTLFLTNQQKTKFYLFVTTEDKKFDTKKFSQALGISRVSFASREMMIDMLGTIPGTATALSLLMDNDEKVQIVFDKDAISDEHYACCDGTTTGYMSIETKDLLEKFLPYTNHKEIVIEI